MTLKHNLWELRKDLIEEMFIFPEEGTKILRKFDSLIEELQQLRENLVPQKQYYDFEVDVILKEILGVEPHGK